MSKAPQQPPNQGDNLNKGDSDHSNRSREALEPANFSRAEGDDYAAQTIKPFSVPLSAKYQAGIQQPPPQAIWWRQYRWQMTGLVLLSAVLLAVIFVLPAAISPPTSKPESLKTEPLKTKKPIESPWEEAQLAKQRREAQEILARLLDKQTKLEKKSVTRWAESAFNQAMETAATGDKEYRQRNFNNAKQAYLDTESTFDKLLTQATDVQKTALEEGYKAIDAGEADLATERFNLVLAIRPGHTAAEKGLKRAQVLEKVLALVKQGEELELNRQLEEAQSHYEKALSIDRSSQPAKTKLIAVKEAILNRDFTAAMSTGYASLQERDYAAAIKGFKQALKLKPKANEAKSALTQAENQQTQVRIQQLLKQAEEKEANERWAAAISDYQRVMTLDKNVVKARVGKIRAEAREKVDQQLTRLLQDPLRLSNPNVYKQAQRLYKDATDIPNPGPRLQKQQADLASALKLAMKPVPINLQSDNQTEVTVYKVGNLGNFTHREVSLKPGRYTAVGSRNGYRDVRHEFSVTPRDAAKTIVIQCVEKISQGG